MADILPVSPTECRRKNLLALPSTMNITSQGCFRDISLSSSVPICRICHCSSEEEDLIQPCRCSGSVGYAHQSCVRKWIVGSTNTACELCNYAFKTDKKRILDIRKLQFPRPSFKGWLHILLFLAFFSIMLTSLTWIMWSQFSSSQAAQSERDSKEITYAYAINGGFIIMALVGLYLDSLGQCRTYYRRWSLLNQDLVIFPYEVNDDVNYSIKTTGLLFPPQDSAVDTSPTFHGSETRATSTPNTSTNKNRSTETRDTPSLLSCQNSGFAHDTRALENHIDAYSINMNYSFASETTNNRHLWPPLAASYILPTSSTHKQPLHQSMSAPADLRNILVLKETYV